MGLHRDGETCTCWGRNPFPISDCLGDFAQDIFPFFRNVLSLAIINSPFTLDGMNPLETHIRRLVWHQLCFLDIRTCEAQGPRPTIRRDEFDTKLPINVDDNEIHASGKPPASVDRWTDSTFCLIRFEINEMMRTIWVDRPRIERRKISLTAVRNLFLCPVLLAP